MTRLERIEKILALVTEADGLYDDLLNAHPELEDDDLYEQPWFSPVVGDVQELRDQICAEDS